MVEWLQVKVGGDVEVEVETQKGQRTYKSSKSAEGKDTKAKIWKARKRCEEEEMVEEWRSIAERRARTRTLKA